jgi:anti-sigma B factor antagonist
MSAKRAVVVKKLPESMRRQQAQQFVQGLQPFLKSDCPCLVFDFSGVRQLDSAGIEVLLRCTEEVMKRNGDLKLAAIPPAIAVILKLTRVDCLFEIFDSAADAVESFYRFPVHAFQQLGDDADSSLTAKNGPGI